MAILGGPTRGRRSHAIFWLAVMGLAAACGDNTAAGSNADAGALGGASGDASVGTAGRAGSSSGGASGSGGAGAGAGGAAGQAGTGGAHPGRDAGACSTLPTCADMDASSCPRHHPECISGMCCQFSAEAPDCVECTCDSQCPSRAPFCESGRCTACLSKADCPPGMCCGVPVSGGPHACMTMNCVN